MLCSCTHRLYGHRQRHPWAPAGARMHWDRREGRPTGQSGRASEWVWSEGWLEQDKGRDRAGRGPSVSGRVSCHLTAKGCTTSLLFLELDGHLEVNVHRVLRWLPWSWHFTG